MIVSTSHSPLPPTQAHPSLQLRHPRSHHSRAPSQTITPPPQPVPAAAAASACAPDSDRCVEEYQGEEVQVLRPEQIWGSRGSTR
ncbi:hypothetical protein OsI_22113 [Oryza sativa Indica Group]|uniref:Uncharacterized protein n=1 Tax=Oryza sativa subsp. indica TaxID=39946 RepID=B8B3Y1_ORYSI|nr:hypothetical protein OsI_22113 [Oryza sativa Indica Group]